MGPLGCSLCAPGQGSTPRKKGRAWDTPSQRLLSQDARLSETIERGCRRCPFAICQGRGLPQNRTSWMPSDVDQLLCYPARANEINSPMTVPVATLT